MALKLVRHAGTSTVSTMGDDAAHGLELWKLVKGHAIRVNEFGGNDIFIKVTSIDLQTAVTSSNGMYLKGGTTVTVVPEGNRSPIVGGDTGARVALDGTDSDGSDAGDLVHLDGTDSDSLNAGSGVLLNAAEENYFLSVINETASSDGAVHVEVVTQANPV